MKNGFLVVVGFSSTVNFDKKERVKRGEREGLKMKNKWL